MGFLGDSATFLGVLLTLNVLCVFYNPSGNFILGTLISQKDRFKKRLSRLQRQLLEKKKAFMESDDYLTVKQIADSDNQSAQDAFALQFRSSQTINGFSIDISSYYGKMEQVEKSNEQFNAPLFSLFFGLIVFICDELITFRLSWMPEIVFTLYILTALAIIYWSLMWGSFIFRQSAPSSDPEELLLLDERLGICFGSLLKYILCCGLYYVALKYWIDGDAGCRLYPAMEATVTSCVMLVAAVGMITVIGLFRFIYCRVKGKYSSAHVLGHLLGFSVFAMLIAIITASCGNPKLIHAGFFDNEHVLKFAIVLFVLINGVLAPFICPYLKYSWYFLTARSSLRGLKKNMDERIEKFNKEFTRFCVEKVKRDIHN